MLRNLSTTLLICLVAGAALAESAPAGSRAHLRIKSDVVILDQVSSSFLIPVVGSTAGANGTFFRSDVGISNFRDNAQRILVTLIPRANSGVNLFTRTFEIPSYQNHGDLGIISDDFLATHMNSSGLAAILVQAIDGAGNADNGARIDGFSRIWTPLPTTVGTNVGNASQTFIPVQVNHLQGNQFSAFAPGMRQDANYRMNVGIVNLSNTQLTWRVDVFGAQGDASFNVTVPANSMDQVNVPAGTFGTATIAFTMLGGATDLRWSAYAASVDNRSGDGWSRSANY